MTTLQNLTTEQLRRVLLIKEQIEDLEIQLAGITNDGGAFASITKGKRRMSPMGRARIAAGQRARWAKVKRKEEAAPRKRRKMSLASKAKIAAAAKVL